MKNLKNIPSIAKLSFALLFLSLCFVNDASATHIVGGDMTYKCVSPNVYEVSLTLRRDCILGSNEAQFDDPAIIGVFGSDGTLLTWYGPGGTLLIPYDDDDTLNTFFQSDCGFMGTPVCVHQTVYKKTISLPPRPGGYFLAYQRCCRNGSLSNIQDPLDAGSTYYIHINDAALADCNSSPIFDNWGDVYICANQPLVFSHTASDAEGDDLVYSLCTPSVGASFATPVPLIPSSPPYNNFVDWNPPYSLSNMMGGTPLSIDAATGELTATPNLVGQFLIGVCVQEFRNGVLMSEVRRDFEYNVRDCGTGTFASFDVDAPVCDGLAVAFDNTSTNAVNYTWYFDHPSTDPAFISNQENPTFTYPADGTYAVLLEATNAAGDCTAQFEMDVVISNTLDASFMASLGDCTVTPLALTISNTSIDLDPNQSIVSYDWTVTQNANITTYTGVSPAIIFTGSDPILIEMLLTSSSGCTKTVSQTLSNFFPNVQFTGSPVEACIGEMVNLVANPNPNWTYIWSPTTGLTFPGGDMSNPVLTVTGAETYMVTVSEGNCQDITSVNVTVASGGAISVSGDTTTCDGTLNLTAAGGSVGSAYIWSLSPTMVPVEFTGNPFTGTIAVGVTTIYVQAIGGACNSDVLAVAVDFAADQLSVAGDTVFCGPAVDLTASGGSVGGSYIWSNDPSMMPVLFTGNPYLGPVPVGVSTVYVQSLGGACDSGVTAVDLTNNQVDLDIIQPMMVCRGDTTQVNVLTTQNVTFVWNDSHIIAGGNTATPTIAIGINEPAGSFFMNFTATNDIGCAVDTSLEVVVIDNEPLSFTYLGNCDNYEICFTSSPAGAMGLIWQFGTSDVSVDTNPCYTYPGPGTYEVILSSALSVCPGIPDTMTVVIDDLPLVSIDQMVDVQICSGESTTLTATTNMDPTTISWCDQNGTVLGTGPTITIMPISDVIVTAKVTNAAGCTDTSDAITIDVYNLDVQVDQVPMILCIGVEGQIVLVNNNPNDILNYEWSPAECIVSGGDTAMPIVTTNGGDKLFTVIITNVNVGCMDTLQISVSGSDLQIDAVTDTTIIAGETVDIEVLGTGANDDIVWSNGSNDQIQEVDPDMTTTYTVTVTDEDGCVATDTVTITVENPTCDDNSFFLPNAFSPNNDSANDIFIVRTEAAAFIESMELIVYDRWGEEVFTSTDLFVGWDGSFKNQTLSSDVFAYCIKITCTDGEQLIKTGNVSLLK